MSRISLETIAKGDVDRLRDLVIRVREMRERQRHYFATRDVVALDEAKGAEREIDQLLESFDGAGNPRPIQAKLFDIF